MDIKEIIDNLNLISGVIPDYVGGRDRGLTDDESESLALQAVWHAMGALEKQMPKNITRDSMYSPALCPTCHTDKICKDLGDGYYRYFTDIKYCPECGQLLKW